MKRTMWMELLLIAVIVFGLVLLSGICKAEEPETKYEITIEVVWNSVDTAKMYELVSDTMKIHGDACKLEFSFKKIEESEATIVWSVHPVEEHANTYYCND